MKAITINERIDWKGDWINDKEDPFDKSRVYHQKKELNENLLKLIKKYRSNLTDEDIYQVFKQAQSVLHTNK